MPPARLTLDPLGYYATLGVEPSSSAEEITAAYRRQARLVHPDVPGTGDADAFVALKQAYDVLIHTGRRAAYDRSGRVETPRPGEAPRDHEPGEIDPTPYPEMTVPRTRHPRLHDLPVAVWAGMAVVLIVGVIEAGLHLTSSPNTARREPIPANARAVPPLAAHEAAPSAFGPAPVRLAGAPNFYITPTSGVAILWRDDETRHTLVPWGQLPAFSAVQGLRLIKATGMVEVRVTDHAIGYVEAGRLTPGNTDAAARAWCTYNAGPTPANGEVLTRNAQGHARLSIDNRSGQPAVVKVRSADGAVVASVFLGPGGETVLEGLPDEPARIDFATGEMWSRACHGFAAGMRAQRLRDPLPVGGASVLAIPPGAGTASADLADQAFERE